jgi:TRAP-type mannitol/chloroaromatic compound transport system permease small subunit
VAPTSPDDPTLLRALDACTQAANVVGSVLISLLVLLIGADVLGRNIFGAPISGVPEMVKLSIVAIVFLQAPQALKAGRMTRSDALINKINARFPKVGGSMETLFDLLAMLVTGAIIYASYPIFVKSWTRSDFVGAMGDFTAPTWPVKLMVLIGAALLLLQFLARILRRYRKVIT